MKSTLFRVLANHLICASQILLLVYTLYDGFQDDFQIATLGAGPPHPLVRSVVVDLAI